jgi:hypothetical protein
VDSNYRPQRQSLAARSLFALSTLSAAAIFFCSPYLQAQSILTCWQPRDCKGCPKGCANCDCPPPDFEVGGTWHWLRSPDEEKRVVMGLFNRYCIRCHGVDGRGVWDIPNVPNFTNVRWQETRSDLQIANIILEGRGAVMPPFRGAITLEEAWGLARYFRTFVPGTEVLRPDLTEAKKAEPNGK